MDDELKGFLRISWKMCGAVELDQGAKIYFPRCGPRPAIYRFSVRKADGSRQEYIGETDNLDRRFSHYRNPGPTQPTNLRLNALFKELLETGAKIEVEIAQGWIETNGFEKEADFLSKYVRRLFENFVLVSAAAVDIERLNK